MKTITDIKTKYLKNISKNINVRKIGNSNNRKEILSSLLKSYIDIADEYVSDIEISPISCDNTKIKAGDTVIKISIFENIREKMFYTISQIKDIFEHISRLIGLTIDKKNVVNRNLTVDLT